MPKPIHNPQYGRRRLATRFRGAPQPDLQSGLQTGARFSFARVLGAESENPLGVAAVLGQLPGMTRCRVS
jgi:hypothetical protein